MRIDGSTTFFVNMLTVSYVCLLFFVCLSTNAPFFRNIVFNGLAQLLRISLGHMNKSIDFVPSFSILSRLSIPFHTVIFGNAVPSAEHFFPTAGRVHDPRHSTVLRGSSIRPFCRLRQRYQLLVLRGARVRGPGDGEGVPP